MFAFISFGANFKPFKANGPKTMIMHGQVYYDVVSLDPVQTTNRSHAQLYVIDTKEANENRLGHVRNSKCDKKIVTEISDTLQKINPFIGTFKTGYEFLKDSEGRQESMLMWLVKDKNKDKRRYNLPTANEIAFVFTSADGLAPSDRDICICLRKNNQMKKISYLNENLDPFSYPIFFPRGELGWTPGIGQSLLQFYQNKLSIRKDIFNPLLHGGMLTQQFIIDVYLRIEASRLDWYRKESQRNIRVELYSGLADYVNGLAEPNTRCGKMVILPSSFQGGPRFMQQLFQDFMVIVRDFGKPDLFVTYTFNPNCREIKENLLPGEIVADRPDLVSRIFYLKVQELLEDLTKRHVLGKMIAFMAVVEWQKRGLPHLHFLGILENKLRTAADIDSIISAELPCKEKFPRLHKIVSTQMMHNPCGELDPNARCMDEGKCSKRFPKAFRQETVMLPNSFPEYRRQMGTTVVKVDTRRNQHILDNRFVVPYNPALALKFNSHVNIECSASLKSVKYLTKYITKGHDCGTLQQRYLKTGSWDEIEHYQDCRYMGPSEAAHRLREYPIHFKSHSIERLPVHLENQQMIYFTEGKESDALDNSSNRHTKLMAYFHLNSVDLNAHSFLYSEIPSYYVWDIKTTSWKSRQRITKPLLT